MKVVATPSKATGEMRCRGSRGVLVKDMTQIPLALVPLKGELWKKTPSECAEKVYLNYCWLMFGAMLSTKDELPMQGNVVAEVSLQVFASWPSSHMSRYGRVDGGG
eukprot:Gb_06641 [translate_table: standard]